MDFDMINGNPARAFYESLGAVDITQAQHLTGFRLLDGDQDYIH
jgi:hypothetical protein